MVPSRPASVLSAIHNGLRQSEKARPQGFDRSSLSTTKPRRRGEDWTPPSFKIKRGKKDVTDKGPQPQSRRSRFNDPQNSFGKRSLVYQAKHGELKGQLAALEAKTRGPRDSRSQGSSSSRRAPTERLTSADFMKDFASSPGTASKREPMRSKREGASGGAGSSLSTRRSGGWESKIRAAKDARSLANGHTKHTGGSSSGSQYGSFTDISSRNPHPGSFTHRPERPDGAWYQGRQHESFADTSPPKTRPDSYAKRPERSDGARYQDRQQGAFPDTSSPNTRFGSYTKKPEGPDGARYQDRRQGAFADASSPKPRYGSYTDRPERSDGARYQDRRQGAFADTLQPGTLHDPSTEESQQLEGAGYQDEQDARRGYDSRKTDDGPIRVHHTTAASQFLYGRSVVEAALKDSRRQLYKLYIYNGDDRQNVQRDDVLVRLAKQKGVRVVKVANDGLAMMHKMSGGRPHNGCLVEASPLPQLPLKALGPLSEDPEKPGFHVEIAYQSFEEAQINGTSDFVSYRLPKERNPFILLLVGILDPGNLGAILRSAAFLGVNGVAITKDSSATLTPVALKASAGASEVMTLFSVSSTIDFLTRSKENGWLVYAAVPSTKRSRGNSHLTVDRIETYDPLSSQPTVLVVGSEGVGLTKQVRREADIEVSIPGTPGSLMSVVDSLNVSVATGILCSAFLKKQTSDMIEIAEEPTASEDESDDKLW